MEGSRHEARRVRFVVNGRVQGVGFRPTVYRHALAAGVGGWVLNTAGGVVIEAEGPEEAVARFRQLLSGSPPPRAVIVDVSEESLEPAGETSFAIRESRRDRSSATLFPPDLALCDACRGELLDPADRRHGYPFLNCTDCGPRFTIARELPYDRPMTTMAGFRMCPPCQAEYDDPGSRRFHAQPNACADCGPRVEFVRSAGGPDASGHGPVATGPARDGEPLELAVRSLAAGEIVAVQSLGGFHLACDAHNEAAVAELRRRKDRPAKPFAVMVAGLASLREVCRPTAEEKALLASPAAPIVMVRKAAEGGAVAPCVAPGLDTIGVMLAYTPLHTVLFERLRRLGPDVRGENSPEAGSSSDPGEAGQAGDPVLVMTSGNLQDEPICRTRDEAVEKLGALADAFLFHDRPIHNRCDDSVAFVETGQVRLIRRARGWVPDPVPLTGDGPCVLGCGADLKGAFCLTRGSDAFLSQHLGDLQDLETAAFFREALGRMQSFLEVSPALVAHDLHPDYLSTRLALELPGPHLAVQHHHAHIASVLAERGLEGPVLGLALDGTGYGPDGTVWGGEFLDVDGASFRRLGHLRQVPLAGGDAAARQGWRVALAWLLELEGPQDGLRLAERLFPQVPAAALRAVARMIERRFNAPLTSSAGRLFDAVAALAGVRAESSYEAQAAMEFEALVPDDAGGEAYPFEVRWVEPEAEAEPVGGSAREPPPGVKFTPGPPDDWRESCPRSQPGVLESADRASSPLLIAGSRGGHPSWQGPGDGVPGVMPRTSGLEPDAPSLLLDPAPCLRTILQARLRGSPPAAMAAAFHRGLALAVAEAAAELARREGLSRVILSGGVLQSRRLLVWIPEALRRRGLEVATNLRVPSNDGGIALGQAWIARRHLAGRGGQDVSRHSR